MCKFAELPDDAQVGLFLSLADRAKDYFSRDEYKTITENVLEKCWKWLEDKDVSETQLYRLIDSPEENDIICVQETAEGQDLKIWDCVIYAVAYTCKKAYEHNGNEYFPQPIEIVDAEYYSKSKFIYEQLLSGQDTKSE